MTSLASRIDDLYQLPLNEFVSARAALAKSLAGAEAQRVRSLSKPTLVPWAANQVYWHARPIYDLVMKSGERLRRAQVAALEGKKVDVRAATDAHRRALSDAVQEAKRFAAANGLHPSAEALMRTFEALSLASAPPETPGRLVRPLQPAGFEALTGVRVKEHPSAQQTRAGGPAGARLSPANRPAAQGPAEAARNARRKAETARRKHEAALRRAEAAVERARLRMLEAQEALRRTRDQVS